MLDERRKDLCKYRLKNYEDSLMVAEDCLEKGLYKDAINRSYYAAFYAIKALLDVFHGEVTAVLHPYQFAIDEEGAKSIMEVYDYEWTDEEI